MPGLSGCGTRLRIWVWTRTDLTLMYGHLLLKSRSACRGSPLTDLNSTLGQTNIRASVGVLLKRRRHV